MRELKDVLWDILDGLGEDEVRRKLAIGDFGYDRPLVEDWLRHSEQRRVDEAAKRSHSAMSEQNLLLRSSKNAAWVAAAVSALSVIISIVALWVSLAR
jgi:hypothetical protein